MLGLPLGGRAGGQFPARDRPVPGEWVSDKTRHCAAQNCTRRDWTTRHQGFNFSIKFGPDRSILRIALKTRGIFAAPGPGPGPGPAARSRYPRGSHFGQSRLY